MIASRLLAVSCLAVAGVVPAAATTTRAPVPAADAVAAAGPGGVAAAFHQVTDGLPGAVQVTSAPGDGASRLYVVQQSGTVRVVTRGRVHAKIYLDLRSRVASGGEQGLLGIAFHPHFGRHPLVYAAYTRKSDGALLVSRFRASSGSATSVSTSTERRLITVPHPGETNHNAGQLLFGRHGYLFVSTGDGGGGGDPFGNAEDLTSLSGKILRLDVSRTCGSHNYCIPASNPFPHSRSAKKRLVFDWGLRNPWRMSVDRADDTLWIADVGQDVWEEVNHVRQRGGKDFGWSCREGRHSYNSSRCSIGGHPRDLTGPRYEYNHDAGRCAVIGGYVYRGSSYRFARGIYVFSDYCGGQVYGLKKRADGSYAHARLGQVTHVTGYGESDHREIYAVAGEGVLYHVVFRRR